MKWRAGVYCGARWWRLTDWVRYRHWRFRRTFFNIGPILFYKEV